MIVQFRSPRNPRNQQKAFFRRAALSGRKYVCKFKNMNIKSEKNVDWLLICQHCRLEKCREAGMKDDYVHNLRLHVSLYQTIPKNEKKNHCWKIAVGIDNISWRTIAEF